VPLSSGGNAAAATPLHPCMDNVAELTQKLQNEKTLRKHMLTKV
jgi:hypothetical protein